MLGARGIPMRGRRSRHSGSDLRGADAEAGGRALPTDRQQAYERLRGYGFDLNAEVRLGEGMTLP